MPIDAGHDAPAIPGVGFGDGPTVLFFFKVTCPVCQMAAPKAATFESAYPGRAVGVGQDPRDRIDRFTLEFGLGFGSVPDLAPFDVSRAYDVRVVPTTFVVGGDGRIVDAVESWDREGLNRLSRMMAGLIGAPYAPVSHPGDGLPAFRPG